MNPTLIVFIIYLMVVLGVGLWTFRLNKTLSDFLIAGRRLGPWVVAFSERASGESAWLLIGLPGLALASGISGFWPAIGCVSGILFSWIVISRRFRQICGDHDALTLSDFFESRFQDHSHRLRLTATLIIVFFFTFYVSAQFLAAGKVLNATFHIPPLWGMLIGACIILFYTMMGGFFAVAWTDFVQALIMLFVLVLLPITGIYQLGGWHCMMDRISVHGMQCQSLLGAGHSWQSWKTALGGLAIGLGYMGQTHLLARFMAIRDVHSLKKGTVVAGVWAALAFSGAVLIGLVWLAMHGQLQDQEAIMPMLATELFPAWLAGIAISGAIAAMMSTADSQLLVTTSAISEDIYHKILGIQTTQKKLVMISRIAALGVGIIAFLLAMKAEDLVYDLVLYAWAGLGASFGPGILPGPVVEKDHPPGRLGRHDCRHDDCSGLVSHPCLAEYTL